jgi:hypothetical protein
MICRYQEALHDIGRAVQGEGRGGSYKGHSVNFPWLD